MTFHDIRIVSHVSSEAGLLAARRSSANEWRPQRSGGGKDGTRFRGSDSDAGTAGPDSECSCETG
jgi:hypothetical protein